MNRKLFYFWLRFFLFPHLEAQAAGVRHYHYEAHPGWMSFVMVMPNACCLSFQMGKQSKNDALAPPSESGPLASMFVALSSSEQRKTV